MYNNVDETKLRAVLGQIRPRARTFREAAESLDWLFSSEVRFDDKAKAKFLGGDKGEPLRRLRELVADVDPFEASAIEATVKGWVEREGLKLGAVAQPARVALTGRTVSPGIFEVMELLGKDKTLERLEAGAAVGR
jgi:glutamyl-tRNA synthetase